MKPNEQYIVFQRRRDGSEDFYRGWDDYVDGFGDLKREFWMGLEKLHCLTSATWRTELKIDLADFKGNYKYAHYSFFSVGSSGTNYTLNIAGYTGNAGDSWITGYNLNGVPFSTKDRDNDQWSVNCAVHQSGAWWYKSCGHTNLNGLYLSGQVTHQSVSWWEMKNKWESLKFAQMKLRFRD